jgi:hypothetical protein
LLSVALPGSYLNNIVKEKIGRKVVINQRLIAGGP